MKKARVSEEASYVAGFENGEDLIDALTLFAVENKVNSAYFSVIGAVESARVGYYDQVKKEYTFTDYDEPMEILHCVGNICYKDGVHFVHAHACLSREDNTSLGGHLVGARVFAGEAYIRCFDKKIERLHDRKTGLALMKLDNKSEENLK